MICELIREFEEYCATRLEAGAKIALESKSLTGTQAMSSQVETGITSEFLYLMHDLRRNNIKVALPVEPKTGGDLEIHILCEQQKLWVGIRIQAKKVSEKTPGKYVIAELAHPKGTGAQYTDLMTSSERDCMLPYYLVYLPTSAVQKFNYADLAGANLFPGWLVEQLLLMEEFDAETVLIPSGCSFSSLMCSLDNGFEPFCAAIRGGLEQAEEDGFSIASGDDGEFPRIGADPPDKILKFFYKNILPDDWRRADFGGAVVINL